MRDEDVIRAIAMTLVMFGLIFAFDRLRPPGAPDSVPVVTARNSAESSGPPALPSKDEVTLLGP